jgi:hypothetical protein
VCEHLFRRLTWTNTTHAPVAQWIERRTSNPRVGGSNPSGRADKNPDQSLFSAFLPGGAHRTWTRVGHARTQSRRVDTSRGARRGRRGSSFDGARQQLLESHLDPPARAGDHRTSSLTRFGDGSHHWIQTIRSAKRGAPTEVEGSQIPTPRGGSSSVISSVLDSFRGPYRPRSIVTLEEQPTLTGDHAPARVDKASTTSRTHSTASSSSLARRIVLTSDRGSGLSGLK